MASVNDRGFTIRGSLLLLIAEGTLLLLPRIRLSASRSEYSFFWLDTSGRYPFISEVSNTIYYKDSRSVTADSAANSPRPHLSFQSNVRLTMEWPSSLGSSKKK